MIWTKTLKNVSMLLIHFMCMFGMIKKKERCLWYIQGAFSWQIILGFINSHSWKKKHLYSDISKKSWNICMTYRNFKITLKLVLTYSMIIWEHLDYPKKWTQVHYHNIENDVQSIANDISCYSIYEGEMQKKGIVIIRIEIRKIHKRSHQWS